MTVNKKVAIMQPYLFPYIGYFQLINSVDEFVIYDNIKYTKKGWINRNRILVKGKDQLITATLKKDSDYLDVVQRKLSDNWDKDKDKLLNIIKNEYKNAPYFDNAYEIIEKCLLNNKNNLFEFIYDSLNIINNYLNIKTSMVTSSSIDIDHSLKSQDKVIAICKSRGATVYINAIGGVNLYSKEEFKSHNMDLNFIKSNPIVYKQFNNEFIPWLSIIDVMMFNSKETIQDYINSYTLV
jgi:hypothetical protein